MTREEAIEILHFQTFVVDFQTGKALDMAISALRAQQEVESKLKVVESNEPLTLDELREMDAPVWLRCYQVDGDGYWCLCKNGIIITPAGNRYDVSEIPHWAFYRQKPEERTV